MVAAQPVLGSDPVRVVGEHGPVHGDAVGRVGVVDVLQLREDAQRQRQVLRDGGAAV